MICKRCYSEIAYKNRKLCLQCLMDERQRSKINYKKNKECIKNKQRLYKKKIYYIKKKNNICVRCNRKAELNKTMCKYCSFKQSLRLKKYRINNKLNNL